MSHSKYARLAALVAILSASSLACSLLPDARNIVQKKEQGPVTFHGTVVGSEPGSGCNAHNTLWRFRVEKAFGVEAERGDTLVVASPTGGAICGIHFPEGREVVMFAYPANCQTPSGTLMSTMGSYNVEGPSAAQLDSLYGTSAVRPGARPAAKAAGTLVRSGSRVTYAIPGAPSERRDAEGRAR